MKNIQTASAKVSDRWLGVTEFLLIVSSLATSVAAVLLQQVFLVTIAYVPLSLAVGLNSWEKKRLFQAYQESQASIIRLQQQIENWQFSNSISKLIETESDLHTSIEQIINKLQLLQNKIYWLQQNIQQRKPIEAFKDIASYNDIKELEAEIKEVNTRLDNFRIPDIKQRLLHIEQEIQSLHFQLKNDSLAIQENLETRIHNASAELRSQYTIIARRVEEIQTEINMPPAKGSKYFPVTNQGGCQESN